MAHNMELHTMRRQLPPEDQTLLDLLLAGHHLRDIARCLGIGYSVAGVRAHRLKQKLKAIEKEM